MATPLADLPAELLIGVASLLGNEGVKPLRLTCRMCARAVGERSLKGYFSNRDHIIAKHSLEALASITSAPRLSKKLKSLGLMIAALSRRCKPDCTGRPLDFFGPPSWVGRVEPEEKKLIWDKWDSRRLALTMDRHVNALLTPNLRNLVEGKGPTPAITVTRSTEHGARLRMSRTLL